MPPPCPIALVFCCPLLHAQQAPALFLTAASERWQGRIVYEDGGTNYSDLYEIVFVADGTCIVSVSTKENGVELFQDGDDTWSYDDDFLRLECDFYSPQIERLPAIRWVSVYLFDANQTRFTLLVPPYAAGAGNVRVQFVKLRD
jgi:hypothetical protein